MTNTIFSVEFLLTRYKEAIVEHDRLVNLKYETEKQISEARKKAKEALAVLFKESGV